MEWEELLARDLIGCDLESQESGTVFRGPISKVETQGEMLLIDTEWTAALDQGNPAEGWVKENEAAPFTVNITIDSIKPQDSGQGRVLIDVPLVGIAVIFPKGKNLKKETVKGF